MDGWDSELAREEAYARECLYFLSVAHYRMEEYIVARRYAESLISIEPKNRQALALKALLDEQITKGHSYQQSSEQWPF